MTMVAMVGVSCKRTASECDAVIRGFDDGGTDVLCPNRENCQKQNKCPYMVGPW